MALTLVARVASGSHQPTNALFFSFPLHILVFKQGDIGTSWYVIYKGSVDVVVNGISVATLGEGDGFGELALIAEKPRAASILTKEDGCQFIVVDKQDYLKIQEVCNPQIKQHSVSNIQNYYFYLFFFFFFSSYFLT